jgi:hypothetical protein
MRKIQELCAAMTLLMFVSVSIVAGEISTGVVSPPPPPPASATIKAPGEIGTGAAAEPTPTESETLLIEITLSVLQLLLVI